jgi:SPP1 family phage portal protein
MVNFTLPNDVNELIANLIDHHKTSKLPKYKKLMNYYKGHHAIMDKEAPANTPNNKIANPYAAFIVNTVQGYFLGQPVRYESKDDAYKNLLYTVLDENNEDDVNVELEKTLSITGEAFEYLYIDEEASVQFAQLPNEQTIVHYNSNLKPKIDVALRYYEETLYGSDTPITYVELYWPDKIEHYTKAEESYVLTETLENIFGEVPIIHYINNKELSGDFEIAIPLIDDYDKTLSNNSNEFEYFRNAYLILKGFDGTDDADLEEAVKKRAFKTSAEGDISFLTKDINDTAIMNHLKTLDENIHKACNIPNLTDESFASNLSGVALRYKLWGLENLISAKERKFSQSLISRLKLITKAFNIKGHNFDWKDITPKFTRNLPANVLENSQIIANLKDVIPLENLITLLPFIDDKEAFAKNLKVMEAKSKIIAQDAAKVASDKVVASNPIISKA